MDGRDTTSGVIYLSTRRDLVMGWNLLQRALNPSPTILPLLALSQVKYVRNAVPSFRAVCVLFVLPERQKKVVAHCGGRVAPKHQRTGCMDRKA